MYVLREIAKNQLMAIPPLRETIKRRHRTGLNSDPGGIREVYDQYFAADSPRAKTILELGPGHTYGIMQLAKQRGAKRAVILDIERYIDDQTAQECGIEYELYDGRTMPFADGTFDVVCSHTVLEHVRFPEITLQEIARVLAPNGRSVHLVDLRDHMFLGSDNENLFNCLKFSTPVWNAMMWNRSTYVNRLRYTDWIDQFARYGIETEQVVTQQSACIERIFHEGKARHLAGLSKVDATTTHLLHYGRKRAA